MHSVHEVLAQLRAATASLVDDAEHLDAAALTMASLLPGWSRAHVLTHVAQNADAGVRLLRSASSAAPRPEYESVAARASAIEEGARRQRDDILRHLRSSAALFDTVCRGMSPAAWEQEVVWTTGQRTPATTVVRSRLVEVLVHHVDLSVAYGPAAWPEWFVEERLDAVIDSLNRRHLAPEALHLMATDSGRAFALEAEVAGPRTVSGTELQLLTWLLGRSEGQDLATSDGRPMVAMPSTYTT